MSADEILAPSAASAASVPLVRRLPSITGRCGAGVARLLLCWALLLPAGIAAQPGVALNPDRAGVSPVARSDAAPAARQAGAPADVARLLDEWLRGTGIAASDVALYVVPADGGLPLLAHDSGQAFNPASTMKVLTSLAALSMLGPDYRWRTGAFLRGSLRDGVLHGDLVLRGGGDPKLVVEDLSAFVERLRGAGLREIRGDLVIDDARYDVGRDSVERFDRDLSQPYNVRPFALLTNFKATRVVVRPGPGGAEILLDPPLAGVPVHNDLRISRGPCRHGAWGIAVRDDDTDPRGPRIRVSGPYSAACGEQGTFVSVLSHRQFAGALFGAVWSAAGGVWDGRARIETGAARGEPWLEWESPRTLADVVRDINKFSNNVMSRQVFLELAVGRASAPASVERARDVLHGWLRAQGLELPGLFVENGSGLSRTERIGAAALARVLQHAAASPHADLLRESLPVAGVDGTMRRRLVDDPVAGRAWIKTGSLADVRSIAGYVDAASGRRMVVVFFVNGPRVSGAATAQDRFLRWVHANG